MNTPRVRSTWNQNGASRQAAMSRQADIYTMNQEHPQPGVTDYENGNPDEWAETPTENKSVAQEYEGDYVKRNEIGLGEFRDDTYKHKNSDKWGGGGKYDNKTAAERKAQAAERVSRAILRTSNERLVESVASDLMALPSPALASVLRSMDSTSPDALAKDAKVKRALACCKLAVKLLGDLANPKAVEHLGSVFMSIDDPTLKEIVRTVATSSRVAQEQGEEESEEVEDGGSHTAQGEEGEEGEESSDPPANVGQQEQGQQADGATCGLTPTDMQMLHEMLEHGAPAVPAPVDDLTALFTPSAAPMPAGAAAPMPAPMMASDANGPEISFGEDEVVVPPARTASTHDAPAPPSDDGQLADLFSDLPDVQAQREIQAALREQAAREGGYAASGRTASSAPRGAKKLGAVQASRGNPDEALASVWDRP